MVGERVKKMEREARKIKLDSFKDELKGVSLLGSVVTFNSSADKPRKHKDVVDALTDAGLDPAFARKLLPKSAFSRACKKLSENSVIDIVKDGEDYVRFQFTKKIMRNEEWEYTKDTELTLNKITGEVDCKRKELKDNAQRLLDQAMEDRTTSDITQIVNKLCEKNTDLFFIKAGVYFVPQNKVAFLSQVDDFLNRIGGSVERFPVPAGTNAGDKSVKEAVNRTFETVIEEHLQAVDAFTVSTRADTMQNAKLRMDETRVKIEAYAYLLDDKSKKLFKAVEDAKKKLEEKISQVVKEKEESPDEPQTLFSKSISSVLKWMGKEGWSYEEAKRVIDTKGFQLAPTTIRGQLWIGKSNRTKWGKSAELDEKAVKELNKMRKEK